MMVERLRNWLGDEPGGRCGGLGGELQEQLLVSGEHFFLSEVFAVTLETRCFHGQQGGRFAVEAA